MKPDEPVEPAEVDYHEQTLFEMMEADDEVPPSDQFPIFNNEDKWVIGLALQALSLDAQRHPWHISINRHDLLVPKRLAPPSEASGYGGWGSA